MTPPPLSIFHAAHEAPDHVGLVYHGARYTFAELAAQTREQLGAAADEATDALPQTHPTLDLPGVTALVATPALSTVIEIYAALARADTLVLLSPRASAAERRARLAQCRAALLSDTAPPQRPALAGPPRPQVVVFTSGSRSGGKGVLLSARAFLASAAGSAKNLGWHQRDRWLACLPLAHVGGLSIIIRCLLARRAVVLDPGHAPDRDGGFDPDHVAACVHQQRVTLMSLVPTMLTRLLDAGWSPPAPLRAVLIGGAAASPALVERAVARGVPILLSYGMSETCAQICTQPYGTRPARDGRIGPPIAGAELRIRGGRIQARGPMLFERYLGPQEHSQRWFDTGDCGHLDPDGTLRVLGRADDTIITGGENVHPGEIEPTLAAHPDVHSACVVGLDDRVWGQIVVAALVCHAPPPDPITWAAALARFLAPRLSAHQRPRRILFSSDLPLGATGKVDRRQVAKRVAQPDAPLLTLTYPAAS